MVFIRLTVIATQISPQIGLASGKICLLRATASSSGMSPSTAPQRARLTSPAYKIVQNAHSACGAHDSLTREVGSLHIILKRLEIEVSKPDSILNRREGH